MATIKSQGAVLVVDDGTGTDTDITIGEARGMTGLGSGTATEIDITNWASTRKEFRAGLADGGSATLDLNFDPDDVGQDELFEILGAQETREFKLTFAEGTDKVITFSAFVTAFSVDAPTDDKVSGSVTLRLTGGLTISTS